MTPAQRALARHALGLPNENMRSYRNYYFTREGAKYLKWCEMIGQDWAFANLSNPGWFHLTKAGAQLALDPGETLDEEDFPE